MVQHSQQSWDLVVSGFLEASPLLLGWISIWVEAHKRKISGRNGNHIAMAGLQARLPDGPFQFIASVSSFAGGGGILVGDPDLCC